MRILPNGKPLILPNGKPSHAECCCGVCCALEDLPATLYLTIDQFEVDSLGPGDPGYLTSCDDMCVDGDYFVTALATQSESTPLTPFEWHFDCEGAGGGPINIVNIGLTCQVYPDGVARYLLDGGIGVRSGRWTNCDGVHNPAQRLCVIEEAAGGLEGLKVGAATCDPFFLQGTIELSIWRTIDDFIFLDRCTTTGRMRITVTE
jgi:hypothetical protein